MSICWFVGRVGCLRVVVTVFEVCAVCPPSKIPKVSLTRCCVFVFLFVTFPENKMGKGRRKCIIVIVSNLFALYILAKRKGRIKYQPKYGRKNSERNWTDLPCTRSKKNPPPRTWDAVFAQFRFSHMEKRLDFLP